MRISKPTGKSIIPLCIALSSSILNFFLSTSGVIQGLFYRGDRHCHFLNYLVIIDIKGYVCYSRPGFVGHLNDTTCYEYSSLHIFPFFLLVNTCSHIIMDNHNFQ